MNSLINDPAELRKLPESALKETAAGLRREILDSVSRNGGHLASSLGAVELIIALHRVFNTPHEKIFFDVGHQTYAHKLLTGRRKNFARLRQHDGVSGFINPAESVYDTAVSGHTGVAISEALGCAAAAPDAPEKVVAVIGDGSTGNGGTFEALNHVASCPGSKRLIIILNDNRMSISGNVGAVSQALNRVIAAESYNRFRTAFKKLLAPLPKVKGLFSRIYDAGKSLFLPPAMLFETLGIRYFGAVNGNDLDALLPALKRLRRIDGPVLLHIITKKGCGCDFASADPTRYHGISGCDPVSGELPLSQGGFSAAFGKAMLALAEEDPRITAVCPAMTEGTGLAEFSEKFPERCFDVGIAESHAITFAAGLALGGKIPVCAFYDTFLQRALDAVYHDIALPGLPVVIIADRAGAVPDGPTHHGIFNNSFLRTLPGMTILTPAHENEVDSALRFAVSLAKPVVIRYPRGGTNSAPAPVEFQHGKAVVRKDAGSSSPVIWASGAEVGTAMRVADILNSYGIECRVFDARFLKPFDSEKALQNAHCRHFVIEDHVIYSGLASALCEAFDNVAHAPVTAFGWSSDKIVPHGKISSLRHYSGLNAEQIAEKIRNICKNI